MQDRNFDTGGTFDQSGMGRHFDPSQFRKGMDVYSNDDQKIGTVDDVYGNRLMIKKGMFFGKDVYIPFTDVMDIRNDRIYLSHPKDWFDRGEWDRGKDYNWSSRPSDLGEPYYGTTGTTYGTTGSTYGTTGSMGGMQRFQPSQFHKGMDVYSNDDQKIGTVDDVYGNRLFVKKGMFFGKDVYIPFTDVMDVRNDRIYLSHPKDWFDRGEWDWSSRPSDLGDPYYGTTGTTYGTTGTMGTTGYTGSTYGTSGETFGTMGGMQRFQPTEFKKGMDIFSSDDQKVCSIDDVYNNYVECKKGLLFGSDIYIPFSSIRDVRQDKVYLSVPKDQIDTMDWTNKPSDLGEHFHGDTGDYNQPFGQE